MWATSVAHVTRTPLGEKVNEKPCSSVCSGRNWKMLGLRMPGRYHSVEAYSVGELTRVAGGEKHVRIQNSLPVARPPGSQVPRSRSM
ncbi:MAG: hypothetical protein BWZ02_03297 [Lentisphaerae bacterium ADurb.BinA184]|nr:MAG: hypothetical protein BWZ02_03297 [Lentisphaerae bacterium ADurb.BinA184]